MIWEPQKYTSKVLCYLVEPCLLYHVWFPCVYMISPLLVRTNTNIWAEGHSSVKEFSHYLYAAVAEEPLPSEECLSRVE